jgi:sugar phosphate isomerase/epimerase
VGRVFGSQGGIEPVQGPGRRSGDRPKVELGVELVTFYEPAFWGVDTDMQLIAKAKEDPERFWGRLLESLETTGVRAVEMCFAPGDLHGALDAYGSPERFAAELDARGLQVVSGFLDAFDAYDAPRTLADETAIMNRAVQEARLLHAAGGEVLVLGMPGWKPRASQPPVFRDLDSAKTLADLLNRLGAAVRGEGVRLALHTELGSVFCARRDVDLIMLLTDPEYVSLCVDTGQIMLAGSDPLDVVNAHFERLAIMHWKDAIGPWLDTVSGHDDRYASGFRRVGQGAVDWFALARRLRELTYRGWIILELDRSAEPVAQVADARDFVVTALSPLRPFSRL